MASRVLWKRTIEKPCVFSNISISLALTASSRVSCSIQHGNPWAKYCIVNIKFYEQVLEVPYAYAHVLLDGADLPIMHLIQECPVAEIRPGMRVQAVWKDPSEWTESLENIRYFKPTGEADAPIGRIMEEIRKKSHA